MSLKDFILKNISNYQFKIVKINEVGNNFLNLLKTNVKEDKKFLKKLRKLNRKVLANFIFLLRAIDFRLWEFPQNWIYKNEGGFFGLLERMVVLFKIIEGNSTSKSLNNFTTFKKIISPKESLGLSKLRYKIFQDCLSWLKKYDYNFDNYFEENENALDFCLNLFDLEKFRDYHNNIYFLKPNQLLYFEYILAKGLEKNYKNQLETLTIFADYKIPQFFINFGLIKFGPKYLTKIKENKIIKKFSLLENELRMASILLGEKLNKKLKIPSYKVDNILWALSNKIKFKIPFPKVKTIFY